MTEQADCRTRKLYGTGPIELGPLDPLDPNSPLMHSRWLYRKSVRERMLFDGARGRWSVHWTIRHGQVVFVPRAEAKRRIAMGLPWYPR
jgi:hypothetical protein